MKKTSFMWVWAVESHGAGIVERNTVGSIMTLTQVNGYPQRRTIIVLFAAKRRKILNKKSIAKGVIPFIVQSGGKPKKFVHPIYQTGETSVGSFPVSIPVF